jgi:hypothetical protein
VSGAIQRRVAALEASRRPAPGYVVYVTAEQQADPAVVEVAIAEHRRRTGWVGPVMLAPPEMTVEEWMAENGPSEIDA